MSECSCSEMKAGGSPGIAVIGSGSLINDMVGSYSRLGVLRLVCDKNRAVLDHFRTCHPNTDVCAAFYEVLTRDDIQGIAVSGPVETHFRLALEALLAGKHVFLQSPLVQNEVDGHQLLSLAEEEGLVLMSGHPVLYHPAFVKLEEMVRSGVLGKIRYIHTSRFSPGTVGREESITESFSPRDIAMILAMAGETPETITASGGSYLHKKIPDVMNTHITFPSGLQAQVFVSWLHPFEEQRMVVIGENRTAIFDDTRPWDRKLSLLTHPVDWKHRVPRFDEAEAEPVPVSEADPFHLTCVHFLNCVATKTAPRTGAHDELRLFKVLKAAEKSLEEGGKKVRIAKSSVAQTIDDYFVHETASVDENIFIGKGSKIWHFSHIMSGARMGTNCVVGQNVVIGPLVSIGNNCRIQNNVSVYKGVILEDGVFCGPSMVFTNIYNPRAEIQKVEQIRPTLVRKGATIGANATIVCGITIGKYAFVGAGAVVNRDVLDFALVVGNPARQVGWVCECGERLPDDLLCPECGKQYEKTNDGQIGKIAALPLKDAII